MLYPQPVRGPDGEYKYPRELWERLISLVGPRVSIRSRESIIESERRKIVKFLKDLKSQYRYASPEERKYIMGVFSDYHKHGLRMR